MPRKPLALVSLVAVVIAIGGCTSFDDLDRSATALAQRMEDEERCRSRPGPNGQTTVNCAFWTSTHETTTTTVTTAAADGRVTTTTTRTVNGEAVPDRR